MYPLKWSWTPNPLTKLPPRKSEVDVPNLQHNSPLSISHDHRISEGQDEAIKRTHELSHELSQTRKASLSGRCRKPVLGVRSYLSLPVLRPRFELRGREVEMPTSASQPPVSVGHPVITGGGHNMGMGVLLFGNTVTWSWAFLVVRLAFLRVSSLVVSARCISLILVMDVLVFKVRTTDFQ